MESGSGLAGRGWDPEQRAVEESPPPPELRDEPPPPHQQPPRQPTRPDAGVARSVRNRSEQSNMQNGETQYIWTFRIERHDADGNALPPIPVEMRGASFSGSLDEGDWVEIPTGWQPGRTLQLSRIMNLTTGTEFGQRPPSPLHRIVKVIAVIIAVLIISVIAWIAVTIFTEVRNGPPDFPEVQQPSFPEMPEMPEMPELP